MNNCATINLKEKGECDTYELCFIQSASSSR